MGLCSSDTTRCSPDTSSPHSTLQIMRRGCVGCTWDERILTSRLRRVQYNWLLLDHRLRDGGCRCTVARSWSVGFSRLGSWGWCTNVSPATLALRLRLG